MTPTQNGVAVPARAATPDGAEPVPVSGIAGIANAITLRCPGCKSTMEGERADTDPKRAALMEIICPECDDGDRHSPVFFADDGSEVPWYEGQE